MINLTFIGADNEPNFIRQYESTVRVKEAIRDKKFIPLMAGYYADYGSYNMYRMQDICICRQETLVYRWRNPFTGKPHYRTKTKHSCQNKFCPLCGWQQAKNNKWLIARALQRARYKHHCWITMLRLSRSNVIGEDISKEIRALNQSFDKLKKRRAVAEAVKGYIKIVEITYNPALNNYNVHLHILIATDKSYIQRKNYICWFKLWQEANPFITVNANATLIYDWHPYAIANYYSKPPLRDYDITQQTFNDLYNGLFGCHRITSGGCLKLKGGDANE